MTSVHRSGALCATHRNYLMSCEDFDAFDAEYGDRCAICGKAGRETGHGYLNIDHDAFVGQWAVRGRLCTSCNTRIADDTVQTPADAAYLAAPWYQRRLTALGLRFMPESEPDIGVVVAIQKGRLLYWRRSDDGWKRVSSRSRTCTWRQLNKRYGPHRIRILRSQPTVTVRHGRVVVTEDAFAG